LVNDPSVVEYGIAVEIVTYSGAINSDVQALVNTALNAYRQIRLNKLGMDIVRSQITALCMIPDKVYNASIISPVADIVADESTYTRCTGISLTITGSNDG
jgi:phage-related baseplate assembly protein